MGKVIVQHVDEAPWLVGMARKPGEPFAKGGQFIGDLKQGPWIHVFTCPPNDDIVPHAHDVTEFIIILEGEIRLGKRTHGVGTVLYVEGGTQYGFKVGPNGVRFINIRLGPAVTIQNGVVVNRWSDFKID